MKKYPRATIGPETSDEIRQMLASGKSVEHVSRVWHPPGYRRPLIPQTRKGQAPL